MKELLEEIISKFNECKSQGLHYHTYKDKGLSDVIEKAEAFLKGDGEERPTVDPPEAQPVIKSKGKK